MKLNKAQRETLRLKFDGKCSYCGEDLKDKWHADHLMPVVRLSNYVKGKGFVSSGEMDNPQNDNFANMMPSCPPCNIDKHAFPLEAWRKKLENSCDSLKKYTSTYRHALRFGLVIEQPAKVLFYFEKFQGITK
jgi:hypothetical protein